MSLSRLGPPRGSEQAEDPAQAEVTEGEGHGRSWSLVANTASSGQRSRWYPTPRRTAVLFSAMALPVSPHAIRYPWLRGLRVPSWRWTTYIARTVTRADGDQLPIGPYV